MQADEGSGETGFWMVEMKETGEKEEAKGRKENKPSGDDAVIC